MKLCNTCGQQLPDNAKFCSKCGAPQPQQNTSSMGKDGNPLGKLSYSELKRPGSPVVPDYFKILLIIPAIIALLVGILATVYGVAAGPITVFLGVVIYFWPYRSFVDGKFYQAFLGSLILGVFYAISALLVLVRGDFLDGLLHSVFAGCLLFVAKNLKKVGEN